MEKHTHTAKFLRQRKMALALPLIFFPFLSLFAWGMGMGTSTNTSVRADNSKPGLNTNLPDAQISPNNEENKMAFYDKAMADSAKLKDRMLQDPYAIHSTAPVTQASTLSLDRSSRDNVDRVYEKLDAINTTLNAEPKGPVNRYPNLPSSPLSNRQRESEQLEKMMASMQKQVSSGDNEDPEINQLNGMLDKILDIQHPQRMQEKIKQTSEANRGKAYVVSLKQPKNMVSLLSAKGDKSPRDSAKPMTGNSFFGQSGVKLDEAAQNAIGAVVHQDQTILNGSTLKLRLIDNIYVNGTLIPKNTLISGTATLNGERLAIEINSIRNQNSIFPVSLSVYDQDGLPGIHIQGTIGTESVKESAQQTLGQLNLGSIDQGIGTQAASAGIELSKNLFGKKIKQIKVTLPAGYVLLLADNKQINNQ